MQAMKPLPRSDVALRLAEPGDARDIALASRALIEAGLPWTWTPARVADSIRDPETNVLVARSGGLLGFGIMRYGLESAHLELLAVSPAHRRAGIARRIVEWLETPAVVGGLSAVWLEVRAGNTEARAFYERLGYRTVALLPRYYDGREAAHRMGREL
jgi:ribosomal-protein-alanine N-acetyltransferase